MKPRRRYAIRTPRPLRTPPGLEVPGQRELLAVREVVHAFLHADRPEEAFQFALDRVAPAVGATFACVYLLDGASELMRLVAAHNWPERLRPWLADVRVRVGFGPSGEAASERRAIEVPDVFADPDLEDWQDVARELGFRALVSLPLQSGHAALGAVTFYFREWEDFTVERRGLLRLVADLMASAVEHSRVLDRVRRAEAAAVEALTELDRQYVAVSDASRTAREFVLSAADALRPALDALDALASESAKAPVVAEARQVIDDLVLLSAIEAGEISATRERFDPRGPLRVAMGAVARLDARVHLIAEEPIHELPMAWADHGKVAVALTRLLARAVWTTTGPELRASVTASEGRILYRLPGHEGDDVACRLAFALAALTGGSLEFETAEGAATVVLALPIDEKGGEPEPGR